MGKKFIIADNQLILANVEMHRDITENHQGVVGGGWWYINDDRTKLYLYSKSVDFGNVSKEQLISALENGYLQGGIDKMEIYFSDAESLSDVIENGELITFNNNCDE